MRMAVPTVKRVFCSALEAVLPPSMVRKHLKRYGDTLVVDHQSYQLSHNVHIVGFGKAVSGMCRAVQDVLGDHVVKGILSVPVGTVSTLTNADKSYLLPLDDGKVRIYEGATNNLPDEDSHHTTLKILEMLHQLKEGDLVVTLVSGGGSALLCAPVTPLTLEDKLKVTTVLAKQGASIQELNTVRKALSRVKGGGLARAVLRAKMVTLVLSDVIGDPLDLIASGPTTCSRGTADERERILKKYDAMEKIPGSALKILLQNLQDGSDRDFPGVQNVLVGSNTFAISAAVQEAQRLDYKAFVLSRAIEGEAREIGAFFMELCATLGKIMIGRSEGSMPLEEDVDRFLQCWGTSKLSWNVDLALMIEKFFQEPQLDRVCIIGGGETTVTVSGNGLGGRNQEMTLAAAIHHHQMKSEIPDGIKFTFLSAGTDGQDGPTDAAGAMFGSQDHELIKDQYDYAEAEKALANNDSCTYLTRNPENILRLGLTGTNVMDLQILALEVVEPSN